MIYFDYNATAPLHFAARATWLDACEKFIGNPSSPHRLGGRAENALDEARQKLASLLGCNPLEIVWTSGATESSNMVFHHFSQVEESAGEVWVSAIEHPATIVPAKFYFQKHLRFIPVNRSGLIDLNWLTDSLRKERPRLIVVMAANNETGVLQPWQKVAELCRQREIPFFGDAVQWLGKLPARGLGECDFISGSAHKFGGPRGVGFLKFRATRKTNSLVLGGKQQEGRRAGTENVPGVLAMMAVLSVREEALNRGDQSEPEKWRDQFERELMKVSAEIKFAGEGQKRLWNTSLAFLPDVESRFRWVVKLDKAGFAVSTGSACASGEEKPSHVLSAMNYKPAQITRAIRFSSGWETSESEWAQMRAAIGGLLRL